jgi:Amt family ammonium transporter
LLNNLLGTSLLWFGWFGFNAGSALAASDLAVLAIINTNMSAAIGGLTWVLIEKLD